MGPSIVESAAETSGSAAPLEEWVKEAQRGERLAFEQLVRQTEGLARKTAFPLLPSHLVDDAVQESYLVVFQKLGHLRDPRAFQAWLCRIVLHVCYAMQKKYPTTAELEDRAVEADHSEHLATQMALRGALAQISEEARNVLILREFLGLDYEEIAFALNLPMGTVRSRLHYGRKKLAKLLDRN